YPGNREVAAQLELRSWEKIVNVRPQVPPHWLVVAVPAFGKAAADRIPQQLQGGDALLDAGALALGESALLFGYRVGFADAVAAGRLNLASEPAYVAFELDQLGVGIFEGLCEGLAAQLPPLGFSGIGRRLLDSGQCCGLDLLRHFTARDFGDEGRI